MAPNGTTTHNNVGVQSQTFTVVNDENYYYPDLFKGMMVAGDYGSDIAYYTGSTAGTSRDNDICSAYSPITWQVDRKCHLISASSFDKMCADMKAQVDDMSKDLYVRVGVFVGQNGSCLFLNTSLGAGIRIRVRVRVCNFLIRYEHI